MNAPQQFTLVLPFKISAYQGANELARLTGILLPSLHKFMDTNAVQTFLIVCKDTEEGQIAVRKRLFDYSERLWTLTHQRQIVRQWLDHAKTE